MADARRLNERLVLFDADKRGLAVNFRFSLRRRSFHIALHHLDSYGTLA